MGDNKGLPTKFELKGRKVGRGGKSLTGFFINAPAGSYTVLGHAEGKEEIEKIPEITRGREYARIVALKPGSLLVVEAEELIGLPPVE